MQLRHSKYLLWLFAATVLLVQSIAVWHDAEHAFHDHVALCDQLNVISHTPSIDTANQLSVGVWQQHFQHSVSASVSGSFDNTYHSFAIRAPPVFS
jgi:hypothetical protein